MNSIIQFLANNMQLLIVAGLLLFSAAGGIARWLKEQAARREIEQRRRRQIEQQLRTGRADDGPAPATPASAASASGQASSAEAETFAQRRARQIEEMRRRQEQAARAAESARRGDPVGPPAPAAPTPSVRRPIPAPPPPRSPLRQHAAKPAAPIEDEQAIRQLAAAFERQTLARRTPAPRAAATRSPDGLLLARLTPAELRRAVLLTELLSPPVSMRQDSAAAEQSPQRLSVRSS